MMPLPTMGRCCGCIPLEKGCIAMTITSIVACIVNIAAGTYQLPHHQDRMPEDNLISLSMFMFSTLSLISNVVILIGIRMKRPGYIQLSLLFNSLFILFCFLVGIVTCLFSPELRPYLDSPGHVALVVLAVVAGAAYCIYFLLVVNSTYNMMKLSYYDTSVPV